MLRGACILGGAIALYAATLMIAFVSICGADMASPVQEEAAPKPYGAAPP